MVVATLKDAIEDGVHELEELISTMSCTAKTMIGIIE
jgi:hypothetical protein